MNKTVKKPHSIQGVFKLPPDKSISHRAALFNAIAEGSAQIFNYSTSLDCQSTLESLTQLGASIKASTAPNQTHNLKIHQASFHETSEPLDAGNSGTTLRLLTGFLASQPFFTTISGDSSLRKRPMGRIIEPLTKMGASIVGKSNNTLAPLKISGQQRFFRRRRLFLFGILAFRARWLIRFHLARAFRRFRLDAAFWRAVVIEILLNP